MKIKASEISELIKEQIKNYHHKVLNDDVGTVISVGDGIALVFGLEKAMLGELLEFPHSLFGMVLNLEEKHVGVILLGSDRQLKEGDIVKRTKRVVEVPVGDMLLGRVVNALGQPIDGLGDLETVNYRPVERIAPGVMDRESINTPLQTGIKAIDAMIPIGRGQRELIIGDRQTGKTALAIDAIINQKKENVLCIYVAIGQKNSTVAQIVEKLRVHGALPYTVIVSATASELAPLQYLAPYSGVTMAEEWMEEGKDVLIVYDDLSKHAVAYRTLSLLLKRSPGREAYPGDIFYLHSRLLERACKLSSALGGGSITALPIIETQAGDISAYIPTNVISITDGQIFLTTELFNSGQRPAVDSGLSVSRVGSAAQTRAMKKAASALKIELANYHELLAFAQFGSDVDSATKDILTHGKILMEVLKQRQYTPYPLARQVIELYVAKSRLLEKVNTTEVPIVLKRIYDEVRLKHKPIINSIKKKHDLTEDTAKKLKQVASEYIEFYLEDSE